MAPAPNVVPMEAGGVVQRDLGATDRALADYLRKEVAHYSPYYGPRLRTPLARNAGTISVATLVHVPFTRFSDLADPGALVLRPDPESINDSGDLRLTTWLNISRAVKREAAFNREVDRDYKPILWWIDAGVPFGASASDERRLGDLGRQWLEGAGVRPYDSLVSVVRPGPWLAFWNLWHGARAAGLSALHLAALPSADELLGLQPAVLAGAPTDLLRLLEAVRSRKGQLNALRTLLVVGTALEDGTRQRLQDLGASLAQARVAAVAAWAPPGARALWAECRGSRGVHLWPGTEVVEVVDAAGERVPFGDEGELVWTAIGWHGSVVLRLRTGVRARIDATPCATCGAAETVIPASAVDEETEAEVISASEPRPRRGLASLADIARGKRRG